MLRNHHRWTDARQETNASNHPFDFDGPTVEVAQKLVGALLIRTIPQHHPDAGARLVLRIVETEAYLPLVDPSCHAYRGPTRRNASAFGRPGTAYVYFIYGNHFCLNVATEPAGIGAAVLVRAAEPLEGIDAMRARRPHVEDARLASGPGNLCRALSIDRDDDGTSLAGGGLHIAEGAARPPKVFVGARIGLSVARDWPLRFFDAESPSVSAHRHGRQLAVCVDHLVDGPVRSVV